MSIPREFEYDKFELTEASALFDGPAYEEMEALLERAQKTIRLTFYLFGGPDADRMAVILARKKATGVDVRVLLDRALALGPTAPEVLWECRRTYRLLQKMGLDVRRSDSRPLPESPQKAPLSHHKYIVADDDAEALVGGMNVGTLFRGYHDLMLRLRGPVASGLSRQFDADWNAAGGEPCPPPNAAASELSPFSGGPLAASGPTQARIVGTTIGRQTTRPALLQNLRRAEKSVCVALCEMGRTPLVGALIACHRRGVAVRVLLDPQITARVGPSGLLNAGATEMLLGAGVPVHLYTLGRDFVRLHLKMAIFDGVSAVAGSTNWTRGGFEWVGETDVELHGGSVVAELAAQFEADWLCSTSAPFPSRFVHFFHDRYEKWAQ